MAQDTNQNGVRSALFVSGVLSKCAWFVQADPVQVGPGPPKSAQEIPNRSPKKSWKPHKIAENTTQVRTWENLGGNSWDWGFLRFATL